MLSLRKKMQFYTSDLGAPGRDHLFGYGLIRFKEITQPLEKAQKAVGQAEKTKKKADIQTAQKAIEPLPADADKTALKKRLNTVKEQLKKTAESKVKLAEKQKRKPMPTPPKKRSTNSTAALSKRICKNGSTRSVQAS